ncbi:MAG: 30S ribosomal protein S3 [Methanomassiliicoccales archaeon]|jgi:small subunit ribosomal protein S3|nr:30S ribosomal protein S3 [Methanomassiliicoccales archaeon]
MASERKFVTENIRRVLLKEYLMKEVGRAGFGGVDVQRTPMGTRVTLVTERPGIVIGRRGASIKNLTRAIEEDFNFDNPQIEVQEVENANLNAQIMAEKLAFALERGWHFRRAGHSTVRRIMDNGARGCLIVISGKLTGQRHRTEKFKEGHIKFCGEPRLKFIRKGFAVAKLKPGVIGVRVEIMDPAAKLPDEVEILTPEKAAEVMPEMAEQLLWKEELAQPGSIPNEKKVTESEAIEKANETVEEQRKKEGIGSESGASAPTTEKTAAKLPEVPTKESSKEA